jgi:5-carboxymethyl-2-hydroxymuconate isomerase
MPHIILEHSANLESDVDINALVQALHDAALTCPTIDLLALRSRAERRERVVVADGNLDHRFAMVTARILAGRSDAVKKQIADTLFATLKAGLAGLDPARGLALAVDIVEIEPATFRKEHNLTDLVDQTENVPG